MGWKYNCVNEMLTAMGTAQRSASSRNAFNMGLASAPIWNTINLFNVMDTKRDSYEVEYCNDEIITTLPEVDSCGSDLPLIGDMGERDVMYFSPIKRGVAIDFCKEKCDKNTLAEKLVEKEKQAGVGFGKLAEQMFWQGNGLDEKGITGNKYTQYMDLSAHPKYSDLSVIDATGMANFFSSLIFGMDKPNIYVGAITMELLGWRSQSDDNCTELWDCTVKHLATRLGRTPDQVQSMFIVKESFDCMIGIDALAPTDKDAVIMAVDRDRVRLGVGGLEIGCPYSVGEDMGYTSRKMYMTAPQITKLGAVKFAYNFIDHNKIVECENGRYDCKGGQTCVTVPTVNT